MPWRTRLLLALLAVVLALTVWKWTTHHGLAAQGPRPGAQRTAPDSGHPNVLLISLDTVRPDHLGCYGYAKPTSPGLNRFARGAVRFSHAYAQAPWTVPSHMSLFTSTLPSDNGIESFPPVLRLSSRVPTLAEILQAAGYRAAAIVNGGGVGREWGFDRGYELYAEFPIVGPEGRAGHITDMALEWMSAAGRDRPWYLFVHYYDAHDPYDAPEPYHTQFGALPAQQTTKLIFEHNRPDMPFADAQDLTRLTASYDAAIAGLDQQVGRLLDHIPPHTLVVVFSDHGEAFKEHGWTWHGATLYEEEVRAALLIRPPEAGGADPTPASTTPQPQGPRVIDAPVMLMDVAPTILGYCGIATPPGFEGADLRPLLGGANLSRRVIASETMDRRPGQLVKALIDPPWKLIHHMDDGREELYELPNEQTNRIASPPPAAGSLRKTMHQWLDRESYWMVYLNGPGEFEGTITAAQGQLIAATVVNIADADRKSFDFRYSTDGDGVNSMVFSCRLGQRVQAIYLRTLPGDAPLAATLRINQQDRPDRVFVGRSNIHPTAITSEFWIGPPDRVGAATGPRLSLGPEELLAPSSAEAFHPKEPGFYIRRFGTQAVQANPPTTSRVGPARLAPFIGLGYGE